MALSRALIRLYFVAVLVSSYLWPTNIEDIKKQNGAFSWKSWAWTTYLLDFPEVEMARGPLCFVGFVFFSVPWLLIEVKAKLFCPVYNWSVTPLGLGRVFWLFTCCGEKAIALYFSKHSADKQQASILFTQVTQLTNPLHLMTLPLLSMHSVKKARAAFFLLVILPR